MLPFLLSAAFDAALLWGAWRLARLAVFGRAEPARRRAKALEQELRVAFAQHKDILPGDLAEGLSSAADSLRSARRAAGRDRAAAAALDESCAAARPALEAALGAAPKRLSPGLYAFVETLVVAFGVAFAFRAYFLQPFKIPTGSMQPTLFGLHSEYCEKPGFTDRILPLKVAKWALTGRWYRDVVAHADGTARLGADSLNAPGFVLVSVAGELYKVPQDAGERGELSLQRFNAGLADNPFGPRASASEAVVHKGDRIWSGYVMHGDQVFVNRLLWNLRPPRRDEVVVFATSSPSLVLGNDAATRDMGGVRGASGYAVPLFGLPLRVVHRPVPGLPSAQHYIKRLVGLPGETISIRHPRLLVDGAPVEGCPGIAREEAMEPSPSGPSYAGYHNTNDEGMPVVAGGILKNEGDAIELADAYLPMGDNTRSSYDGRYWGPVPRTQMLGPAACVYWPFSDRWGLAK